MPLDESIEHVGGRAAIMGLLADRAYDSDALRQMLTERALGRTSSRCLGARRRCPFSGWLYRLRNRIERFFSKIKHFRAVATRYDKRDDNFLAGIKLAAVRIWLRSYESVT